MTWTILAYTESNITDFLLYYRKTFPTATTTPKLHMLEDHVIEFIQRWKVGLGLMGEQGAESIHARFNQIERAYANMPNGVDRLTATMKEHFREVCPENIVRQPLPKKYKKAKDD